MRCETTRKDQCRYASRCGAQDECSTGSKRCSDSHFSECFSGAGGSIDHVYTTCLLYDAGCDGIKHCSLFLGELGDKLIGQLLHLLLVEGCEQGVELCIIVVNFGQPVLICRSAMFVKYDIYGR